MRARRFKRPRCSACRPGSNMAARLRHGQDIGNSGAVTSAPDPTRQRLRLWTRELSPVGDFQVLFASACLRFIALTSPFHRGQIRRAPAEAYIPPPPGYTALLVEGR